MKNNVQPTDAELKVFGWALGGYEIKCVNCGGNGKTAGPGRGLYGSDKNSTSCRKCAVKKFMKREGIAMQIMTKTVKKTERNEASRENLERAVQAAGKPLDALLRVVERDAAGYSEDDIIKAFSFLARALEATRQKALLSLAANSLSGFSLDAELSGALVDTYPAGMSAVHSFAPNRSISTSVMGAAVVPTPPVFEGYNVGERAAVLQKMRDRANSVNIAGSLVIEEHGASDASSLMVDDEDGVGFLDEEPADPTDD